MLWWYLHILVNLVSYDKRAWKQAGHGGHAGKRQHQGPLKKTKCFVQKRWELRCYMFWFPLTRVQVFNHYITPGSILRHSSLPNSDVPKIGTITTFLTHTCTYISHIHTHINTQSIYMYIVYIYVYICIYTYILTFSGCVSWKFLLETSTLVGPKEKNKRFKAQTRQQHADIWPCMAVELLNELFCLLARLQHGWHMAMHGCRIAKRVALFTGRAAAWLT